MAEEEIEDGKIFAVLGYLFILCLVPLLLKKDNKFALFHGKQGLILFIFEIAAGIIIGVLNIIPILGQILGFLLGITCILFFGILSVVGIIRSLMGEYWKMPVLGDLAEKISI